MAVSDPAKLTTVTLSGELDTIGGVVQAWLRANLAAGDTLYNVEYIRNAQNPSRVTAFVLFEDQ